MTDHPAPDDDWMNSPAPPPKSLDPALNKPRVPVAAEAKPKGKVTPLRPLEALAADLDNPPIAGQPEARPGDGLDPQDPGPSPDSGEALPPAEPGGKASKDRPRGEIWKGCPVKALGVNGSTSYFLDTLGQLRAVGKLERMTIMHLFGNRLPALCYHFPQWAQVKEGEPPRRKDGKFDGDAAASAMTMAAAEQGIFDPEGAVRGVGAWVDDEGQLVYHMGNKVLIGGALHDPSSHQGRIYPACAPIPHPADTLTDAADPVPDMMQALDTWHWQRPDLDGQIVMGMIGILMLGGALDWRPAFWFTGGAGAGKSQFQKWLLHIMGGEKGMIQSTDATARGIASQLGQSTLPVALDELEPGDIGSAKERAIIETARVAASGGRWMRGSSDQKGSSGQLRSTFLFSSILIPGILQSQDLQRIIVLTLLPIVEGTKPPNMRAETWRARGARLKRLLIDRWPSWTHRLDLWREAMAAAGIMGRDAENWGAVMAMAQMMQAEALPTPDEMAGWCAKVSRHVSADMEEQGNDADEVIVHLLSKMYDPFRRGQQYTIAQWLMVAAGSPGAPTGLLGDFASDDQGRAARRKQANEMLAPVSLRIIEAEGGPVLFVGNAKAEGISKLFAESKWAGGAWKQSLARIKGAQPSPVVRTLAGLRTRGVEVPLSSLPGLAAFPADRSAAPVVAMGSLPPDIEEFV
jgi:hypothetical protein